MHSESLDYRVRPCLKNKEIPEEPMGSVRSRVRPVQDSQTQRLRPGRYRRTDRNRASNRGELRRVGQALQVGGQISKGRPVQWTRGRREPRGGPKRNNNSVRAKGQQGVLTHTCDTSHQQAEAGGSGVQSQTQLHREIQARLGYRKPCLQK